MSTTKNETSDPKKMDESSYSDSGMFSAEFRDSSEMQSKEFLSDEDKEAGTSVGNTQSNDDKTIHIESEDSGIIISKNITSDKQTKAQLAIKSFVPHFMTKGYQRQTHQSIEQYFMQDEDGYTKLHIAILHQIDLAISKLISLVPDSSYLNLRNYCGQTALHLAVLEGQKSTVRMLIDAGADVNIRDNRCNTPLHLACLNDDIDCALTIMSAIYPQHEQKLLANLEQWNYDGETCFYIACKSGNIDIMRALVANGADVNAREGRSGYSSLHRAVETNAEEVFKFLCEECNTLNIDTENYGGLTAFQLCLLTEQGSNARYLMSKGAEPYFTASDDDDMDYDDSHDQSGDDELENNQILMKIAEIAVN